MTDILFHTASGAITLTLGSFTNLMPAISWIIQTDLGAVTGFGAPYDGAFPMPTTVNFVLEIGIYSDDVLILPSLYVKAFTAIESNIYMHSACTIVIDSIPKKAIDVYCSISTVNGRIIFKNRSLMLIQLES
jgi:hypothetical protein